MFNNIKWWARPYSANWCLCEWEERVVASKVPLVQYFFHRRERALGVYLPIFYDWYVNGPFLHLDISSRYAQ